MDFDFIFEMLTTLWKLWAQWPLKVTDLNFAALVVIGFHAAMIFAIYGSAVLGEWKRVIVLTPLFALSACTSVFFVPLAYYATTILVFVFAVYFWQTINKEFPKHD